MAQRDRCVAVEDLPGSRRAASWPGAVAAGPSPGRRAQDTDRDESGSTCGVAGAGGADPTRGPQPPLCWTTLSTRKLAAFDELAEQWGAAATRQ